MGGALGRNPAARASRRTKRLARSRNAIVETKDNTAAIGYPSSTVAANSYLPSFPAQGETFSPGLFMLNNAFASMQRGTNSDEMIGDQLYAKYLTTKIRLRFPGRTIAGSSDPLEMGQILHPTHIQIYWGWCRPTNFNQVTTPNSANVSYATLQTHLSAVISPHFNEVKDELGFKEKSHMPYTLEGMKTVKLNRNTMIQKPQTVDVGQNGYVAPPDYTATLKWKKGMNRKYRYTLSTGNDGAGAAVPYNFPNQGCGCPFIMICNWQGEKQGTAATTGVPSVGKIQLMVNNKFWYTD